MFGVPEEGVAGAVKRTGDDPSVNSRVVNYHKKARKLTLEIESLSRKDFLVKTHLLILFKNRKMVGLLYDAFSRGSTFINTECSTRN